MAQTSLTLSWTMEQKGIELRELTEVVTHLF
jgi:hypothetical protein